MLSDSTQVRPKTESGNYYSMSEVQALTSPSSQSALLQDPSSHPDGKTSSSVSASSHSSESATLKGQEGNKAGAKAAGLARRQRRQHAQEQMQAWVGMAPALVRRLLVHLAKLPADQVSCRRAAL